MRKLTEAVRGVGRIRRHPGKLALALLCAVAVGIWLRWPEEHTQIKRLPDGTVMKLAGVTYGKKHDSPAEGFLDEILGGSTAYSFPPFRRRYLIVWFVLPGTEAGPTSSSVSSADEPTAEPALIGPNGWPLRGPFPGMSQDAGEPIVLRYRFPVFPRRGRTLQLRFYPKKDGSANLQAEPVAEFTFPNPVSTDQPAWEAEEYPIRKSDGDVTVTLESLTGRTGARRQQWRAKCRVSEAGQTTTGWKPITTTVTDATGNRRRGGGGFMPHVAISDVTQTFEIPGLFPGESPWKLRIELMKTANPHYCPPEHVWKVQDIAAPGKDAVTRSDKTTRLRGVELELVGVAGKGKVDWQPGKDSTTDHSSRPRVRLRIAEGSGWRTTLRINNEAGQLIEVSYRDSDYPAGLKKGERVCEFTLKRYSLGDAAESLDLTFAVHKTRSFEFLADPRVAEGQGVGEDSDEPRE